MADTTDGPGWPPEGRSDDPSGQGWRRFGWFVLLWVLGVVVVGAAAYLLRLLIPR